MDKTSNIYKGEAMTKRGEIVILEAKRDQILSRIDSGIITNDKTLRYKKKELKLIASKINKLEKL